MENTNTNITSDNDQQDQVEGENSTMDHQQPLTPVVSEDNATEQAAEPPLGQPVVPSVQISSNADSTVQQPDVPTPTPAAIEAPIVQPVVFATPDATAQSPMPLQPQQQPQAMQPLPPNENVNGGHNAVLFVLQWVTYALWGWTLLVLSWVIFALVLSMFNESDMGEFILYPISALVILLPASIVADSFYGKREPRVKKGGALAIMVIHVVLYVLFMVGFLISAMFSIVNMAVSSGDSNDALGYFISSLLVSACYALLITRTLRPQTFRKSYEEN